MQMGMLLVQWVWDCTVIWTVESGLVMTEGEWTLLRQKEKNNLNFDILTQGQENEFLVDAREHM